MGNGKWIKVDSPDEPVLAVARRTLRGRLRWLWHCLPLAALQPEEDVEYVHQLRIATRRAEAALETFAPYLPGRRARWLSKKLRQVRRAAGDARDLDVLKLHLEAELRGDDSAAAAHLQARANELRRLAQPAIAAIWRKLQQRRFPRRAEKMLARLRMPDELTDGSEPTFREEARAQLRRVADTFYTAAAGDLSDPVPMHQFRIAAKQLRYSMEIFAGALGTNFRKEAYPLIEHLQQHLGNVNDHVTFRAQSEAWLDAATEPAERALLVRLLERETAAWQASLAIFHEFWTPQRSNELRAKLSGEVGQPQALNLHNQESEVLPQHG